MDGANVAANTQSALVNSSISLIKNMTVKPGGEKVYEASGVNKLISIKNLVEYSDDFARTVAKDEFSYLDTDNTT